MSNFIFVLDTNKNPLTPCKPSMARKLLTAGKAAVFRLYLFTIILKKEVTDTPETLTLKLDPGSKTTGIALCVGRTDTLEILTDKPLLIKATGHGTRQICRTNKFGFPSRHVPQFKFVKGFQTGDIVKAIVTTGKKVGKYFGRVAVRTSGSFNISVLELVQGISHKYCQVIHKKDGYSYGF